MLSGFSCGQLFVTLWAIVQQAPLSMGLSRQEYWIRLPCFLPEDLPDQGSEPTSFISPTLAVRFFTISTTWEDHMYNPHLCQIILLGNTPQE